MNISPVLSKNIIVPRTSINFMVDKVWENCNSNNSQLNCRKTKIWGIIECFDCHVSHMTIYISPDSSNCTVKISEFYFFHKLYWNKTMEKYTCVIHNSHMLITFISFIVNLDLSQENKDSLTLNKSLILNQ